MMGIIEEEFAKALYPGVRRKPNSTKPLRAVSLKAKARRVAGGAPEVMVKITGFGKGGAHVKSHLHYISRNGKLDLESDRGEILSGKEDIKALFGDWKQEFGESKRHKNQRDTMHMIVSMPAGTDPEAVRSGAREFTRLAFGSNHEHVFVLHTDEPHPHVHITVKTRGLDGRRLHVGKDTTQAWREEFAQAMRNQGVDAEATPRRSRGVIRKPEKQVIRHIEHGDKTRPPRVSRVRAAKIKQAADELTAEMHGGPTKATLWDTGVKAAQKAIRDAWLTAAGELGRSPSQEDRSLASRIRQFVAAMPSVRTERDEILAMLKQRFGHQPAGSRNNSASVAPRSKNPQTDLAREADPGRSQRDLER